MTPYENSPRKEFVSFASLVATILCMLVIAPLMLGQNSEIVKQNGSLFTHPYYPFIGAQVAGGTAGQCLSLDTNAFVVAQNCYLNALSFPGVYLGAKVNAAFASCGNFCTVFIPSGSYTYTTTISYPAMAFGHSSLTCDKSAVLNYTGSGAAIRIDAPNGGMPESNMKIENCKIVGTSAGTDGIRVGWLGMTIKDVYVIGFTNGDCISFHGADTNQVLNSQTTGCKNNIHITTDDFSLGYGSNANRFIGGHNTGALSIPVLQDSGGSGNSFFDYTWDPPAATATIGCASVSGNSTVIRDSYCEYGANANFGFVVTSGTVHAMIEGVFLAGYGKTASIYDGGSGTLLRDNQDGGNSPFFVQIGGPTSGGNGSYTSNTGYDGGFITGGPASGIPPIDIGNLFPGDTLSTAMTATTGGATFKSLSTNQAASTGTTCTVGGYITVTMDNVSRKLAYCQ